MNTVKVTYKVAYGRELFFAADEWTTKFFHFLRPTRAQISISAEKMRELQDLGFVVEVQQSKPRGLK